MYRESIKNIANIRNSQHRMPVLVPHRHMLPAVQMLRKALAVPKRPRHEPHELWKRAPAVRVHIWLAMVLVDSKG